MFSKRCAIALFIGLLMAGIAPTAGYAEGVAQLYTVTSPPKTMPPLVFRDKTGHEVSPADFRGRYVLLNIWATWCGPCRQEMSSLDALQSKLSGKDFTVVALSQDREGQTVVPAFFSRHDLHALAIYVDKGGHAPSLLDVYGMPTSLLINPQGKEIGRVVGPADWDTPEAIAFLKTKMGMR